MPRGSERGPAATTSGETGRCAPGSAPWWAAAAVAVVLLAYLPAVSLPFFYADDSQYVTSNAVLLNIPLAECWRIFITRTNPYEYLPLRDLSYRIDMALFGLHPLGYRLHNLVLYVLCCWATWKGVMALQRRLRIGRPETDAPPTGEAWMAAAVTALFAAHPAHVESVVWIAGRKDLLSGALALVTLWCFANGSLWRSRSWLWMAGAYAAFLGAILSKASVVTLPLVAGLLALAPIEEGEEFRSRARRAAVLTLPLLLLAALSVNLELFASTVFYPARSHLPVSTGVSEGLALALRILGSLTGIGLMPVQLRLIYNVDTSGSFGLLAGILAAAATSVALWSFLRRPGLPAWSVATAGLLLLPFLQIIPFYTWSYASERFLFLPALGFCLAAAAGLRLLGPAARTGLAVILFAAGTGLTLQRSIEWRSNKTLVESTVRMAPGNFDAVKLYTDFTLVPERRYAEALEMLTATRPQTDGNDRRTFMLAYVSAKQAMQNGDTKRLSELAPWLNAFVPDEESARRLDICNMLLEAGLLSIAEPAYRKLLAEFPDSPESHFNLGLTLNRLGRSLEAVHEIQMAMDHGLATAPVWNNFARALRDSGQTAEAEKAYRRAMSVDPRQWHAAYNLARLQLSQGDKTGAAETLKEARNRATQAGDATEDIDQLMKSANL